MKKLVAWLEAPWDLNFRNLAVLTLVFTGLSIVYIFGIVYVLQLVFLGVHHGRGIGVNSVPLWEYAAFLIGSLFKVMMEEFGFRALPLCFIDYCLRGIKSKTRILLICAGVSSLIFSWGHLYLAGWHALYMQGMLGIIWSLLLLKIMNSNAKNPPDVPFKGQQYLAGFAVLIFVHFFYNTVVWLGVIFGF